MLAPSSSAMMTATTDSPGGKTISEQDLNAKADSQMPALQFGPAAQEGHCMQVSVSEESKEERHQLQVNPSEGPAEEDHVQVSASEGLAEEEDHMHVNASEEPAEPAHVVSVITEGLHRRAVTPEELANLGKAVDMVQARSCQLSPSLLTVGQTPPNMDSPARHAFERGRHSCQSQVCTCTLVCHA